MSALFMKNIGNFEISDLLDGYNYQVKPYIYIAYLCTYVST